MLIIAVVLAVIGLASLVAAVATSTEIFAWVCIASSALGVLLLAADAIRERKQRRLAAAAGLAAAGLESARTEIIEAVDADTETEPFEDAPEEIVHDDPESDMPNDDEPEYPEPAEEAAMHIVDEGLPEDAAEDAAEDSPEDSPEDDAGDSAEELEPGDR